MPESLGEKLRQAREEQGITISEVAEQTRISALYLESIENDDYRTLPGGIFNKGFVKSFAKYVGVDENEALQDYAVIISSQEGENSDEPKTYRPEVLTDDRNGGSMLPTIIIAIIILGLMTWGILALVNYLQNSGGPIFNSISTNNNVNVSENANVNTNVNTNQTDAALPSTDEIKVELKAAGDDVSVTTTADGKVSNTLIKSETQLDLEADNSLRIRFARSRAMYLEMVLNGKKIKVPRQPKVSNSNIIDFEIDKNNIKDILRSGEITFDSPTAGNTNTTANVP
ncbi:MAG: helix-turn-helix domain-containing protein [Acidobacteriota bacterium]|jgi:cytoskeletal protein RodZ|nr:helix-turn-helix domain-containing protein [Acidobacteriota bacterium]